MIQESADLAPKSRPTSSAIRKQNEPPRGQYKGPIVPGPRGYVVCPICRMGVPVQLRKKHLRGHQA